VWGGMGVCWEFGCGQHEGCDELLSQGVCAKERVRKGLSCVAWASLGMMMPGGGERGVMVQRVLMLV
jgi:hypothetical protein